MVLRDKMAAGLSSAPLLEVEGMGCVADTSGGLDAGLLALAPLWSLVSLLLLDWNNYLALLCSFTVRRPDLSSDTRDDAAATLSRPSELVYWRLQELGLPQNMYLVPVERFPPP